MFNEPQVFDLSLKDSHQINWWIKLCDNVMEHSDTALFCINERGIFWKMVDSESMCIVEIRISNKWVHHCVRRVDRFSAKFLIPSFRDHLKEFLKQHSHQLLLLFATCQDPHTLRLTNTHCTIPIQTITSMEDKARVFFNFSLQKLIRKSKCYVRHTLLNIEFQRIVNTLCILSGDSGGIVTIHVQKPPLETKTVTIEWEINNQSGGWARQRMRLPTSTCTCKMKEPILELPFLLTYLKKSEKLLGMPGQNCVLHLTDVGIVLEPQQNIYVFIKHIKNEDMDSYV